MVFKNISILNRIFGKGEILISDDEKWGLSREEIDRRVWELNQEKKAKGHPQNANRIRPTMPISEICPVAIPQSKIKDF